VHGIGGGRARRLEFFAEELEGGVADEGGEEGDDEVGVGEDVGEGGGEGFAGGGGAVELAHEEVGVEEEDDEGDLDDGAKQSGEGPVRFGIAGHGVMVQNAAVEGRHAPGVKTPDAWRPERPKAEALGYPEAKTRLHWAGKLLLRGWAGRLLELWPENRAKFLFGK
jgi:hypothetical protein